MMRKDENILITRHSKGEHILRKVYGAVKSGKYKSQQELTSELDQIVSAIQDNRDYLLELFDKGVSCGHTYGAITFTHQSNILNNYSRHFTKSCSKCGKKSTSVDKEYDLSPQDKESFPEGFEGAKEQYYNNFI